MGALRLEVEKGLYLGIDFGTTNSVVSIYQYDMDEVQTLQIDGYTTFPSVVQFTTEEEEVIKIFGIEAKESAIIYPESTITSIKRRLETDEPIYIQVEDKKLSFASEVIVGQILAYLKEQADEYVREKLHIAGEFSGCVITVPANSTDKQKRKMKKAAKIAGFDENQVFLRLEPAAAAIAYASQVNENKNVMVYDFGGGTFDACLLHIKEAKEEPEIGIVSTYGDNFLGGDDLDQILVDIIYDQFLEITNGTIDLFDFEDESILPVREKKMAIVRMKQVANHHKERLSTSPSTKITLAPFLQTPELINLQIEVTVEKFLTHKRKHKLDNTEHEYEHTKGLSINDLIDKTIACMEKCINNSKMTKEEIDEIFLVGGSSAVPRVAQKIKEYFGKEPYQSKISPALSISVGAAYYCKQIMLPSVNGPKVREKTIHSLGIEIAGRRYLEIVKQGIAIPVEGLEIEAPYTFETNFDNLSSMAIVVYEDIEPQENMMKNVYDKGLRRLSGTTLRGIPEGPKGEEKIKVNFKVLQDNMLTVTASSVSTKGLATTLQVDELYEK